MSFHNSYTGPCFLTLNQVHAGRIASVRECLYACVCAFACVCPPLRLLITSGMMWCDIDPI